MELFGGGVTVDEYVDRWMDRWMDRKVNRKIHYFYVHGQVVTTTYSLDLGTLTEQTRRQRHEHDQKA